MKQNNFKSIHSAKNSEKCFKFFSPPFFPRDPLFPLRTCTNTFLGPDAEETLQHSAVQSRK
jgi:hypothetical protein